MGWDGARNRGQRQNLPLARALITFSAPGGRRDWGRSVLHAPGMACVQTGINAAGRVVRQNSRGLGRNYFSGLESGEVRAMRSYDLCVPLLEANVPIYFAPEKP